MNLKISIIRSQVQDLQTCCNLMFNKNFEQLNYLQYYNCLNVQHKVNNMVFKLQGTRTKHFQLTLTPNEGNDLLNLVKMSKDIFELSPYYKAVFLSICERLHTQIIFLDHYKQTTINPGKSNFFIN